MIDAGHRVRDGGVRLVEGPVVEHGHDRNPTKQKLPAYATRRHRRDNKRPSGKTNATATGHA